MRHRRVGDRRVVVPGRGGRSGRPRRTGRAARQRWTTLAGVVSAGVLAVASLAVPSAHAAAMESGSSYATLVDSRPSLLAHWRLGEMSGTTASDTTGRYDGAYTGGPTLGLPGAIAGDTDTAVGFNGATSKVSLPT